MTPGVMLQAAQEPSATPLSLPKRKEVLHESDVNRTTKRRAMNGKSERSNFEHDLERLTQEIKDAGDSSLEKDQKWSRPSMSTFDEKAESLCFQQIDIEESMDTTGPTLRLFGVTEVRDSAPVIISKTY